MPSLAAPSRPQHPLRRHTPVSLLLLVVACLCLLQGLSKGALWLFGERTDGHVVFQESTVSTRGAHWVRYSFVASDGSRRDGRAMTASDRALHAKVRIAYLGLYPDINMPASGSYAALIGGGWTLLGLTLLVVSRVLKAKAGRREPAATTGP
jgi:hypothetical protein